MKKIIFPILVILLLGIGVLVSAKSTHNNYNKLDHSVTYDIKKPGWYILTNNPGITCEESISAVWFWLPSIGKYVGTIIF
jgi:hypothetical protein